MRANSMQMQAYSSDSDFDENEVDLMELTNNMKVFGCPWVNKKAPDEKYDFDVTKCDKIFDPLL
jgi:hypothetical protein